MAGNSWHLFAEGVVGQEFVTSPNSPTAEEQQMAAKAADGKIGIATVIDELSAALAENAINYHIAFEASKIDVGARMPEPDIAAESPLCLLHREPVARILNDLSAAGDSLQGENSPTMNL